MRNYLFTQRSLPFLASFFVTGIALCILGYIYYPGLWTYDSQIQLLQSLGKIRMNEAHPVLMSLIMGVFYVPLKNTIYYLFFQTAIVFLSTIASVFLMDWIIFEKLNLKIRITTAVMFSLFLAVAPPSGYINMILWKDIPATYLLTLQLSSVVCLAWLNSRNSQTDISRKMISCLLVASFCGALVMHFRHNSWTVSSLLFLIAALLFNRGFSINQKSKRLFLSSSVVMFLCIVFIKHYIVEQNNVERRDLTKQGISYMLHSDFLSAYKNGMPVSEQDIAQIEKITGKKIEKSDIPGGNSHFKHLAYQTWLDPKIADMEKRNLMMNKIDWLKAKLDNAWVIIRYPCCDIPVVELGSTTYELQNHNIDINPRMNMNPLRSLVAKFLAPASMGGDILSIRFIWSNFIVVFVIFGFSFVMFIVSSLDHKFSIDHMMLTVIYKNRVLLIIPLICSLSLSLPLMFLTAPSDYRYFWPNIHFAIINVVIWFRILLEFKDKEREHVY